MFTNSRKFTMIIGLSLIFSILCGCAKDEAEYSEETEKMVAEYAAGLLLKYDKNHVTGLTKLPSEEPSEENASAEPVEEVVKEETMEQQMTEPEHIMVEGGEVEEGMTIADSTSGNVSIADALGADGFDINYTGYDLCDSYPNEQDDMYFSLNAEAGRRLLILNFTVSNTTDEELELNTLYNTTKARLLINGTDTVNQQMTMLMNDLKSYELVVNSGESMNSVLVFEIKEDTEIASMDLLLINDRENTYKLL